MNLEWVSLENPVALWWIFLTCASTVNIAAWFWTRNFLDLKTPFKFEFLYKFNNSAMIWYCAAYVFGCAYRSVFTKADVQRIALFDTYLSSVFLGRSVATLAELCFVIQWALILRFVSKETNSERALKISYLIVPIICIAECFSWFAVITTNYIGNSIEESLWAITYSLILVALWEIRQKITGAIKMATNFAIFGCVSYVSFMLLVDVPMYVTRLIEDTKNGKVYLGLWEGLIDLNTRWVVTHNIIDWKTEIPWMSLYFSFAVLVSIALCYVPLDSSKFKKHLANNRI